MKYRVLTLLGLMALTAGSLVQAQDYDDIYYDASTSTTTEAKSVKVTKPAKTIAVYGNVPERYKVAVQNNYRVERDEDEYNRHGDYEPDYAVSLDGDTVYEEAFANTRRIERFYNPDIVILSDDDDLVELYYDESPTINLIVGSDWGYSPYGWNSSFYYPWSTSYWYMGFYDHWFDPWEWHFGWHYGWYSPYNFGRWYGGPSLWGWNYWGPHWRPSWYGYYGWNNWTWHGGGHHGNRWDHNYGWRDRGGRIGLADNRNRGGRVSGMNGSGRTRVGGANVPGRTGITSRSTGGNRPVGVGNTGTRTRTGAGTTRYGGNMTHRNTGGVTTRSTSRGSVSRSSSVPRSSGSSSYGGSRSSGSSHGSVGSYSGGSRSSGGSYSSGGSSSRSSGGGSHGGSSGGGGRRR